MPNSLKSFIINVDDHLKKLGWTKKSLAEKASITPANLTQYLQGNHSPSVEVIDRISKALSVQTWELLKPSHATETPIVPSPTIESLVKIISDQEKKISELIAQKTESVPQQRQSQLKFFIDFLNSADEIELNETIKRIESVRKLTNDKKLKRSEKPKGRSGSTS